MARSIADGFPSRQGWRCQRVVGASVRQLGVVRALGGKEAKFFLFGLKPGPFGPSLDEVPHCIVPERSLPTHGAYSSVQGLRVQYSVAFGAPGVSWSLWHSEAQSQFGTIGCWVHAAPPARHSSQEGSRERQAVTPRAARLLQLAWPRLAVVASQQSPRARFLPSAAASKRGEVGRWGVGRCAAEAKARLSKAAGCLLRLRFAEVNTRKSRQAVADARVQRLKGRRLCRRRSAPH